ncbi:RNA exonuclease 3 [Monosporozyma servazzii]
MVDPLLRPVDLVHQPAKFQDRYKIVHKLHEELVKLKGAKYAKKLIKLAVMLECRVAKSSKTTQIYRFTVNVLIRDLLKHKGNINEISIAGKPLIAGKQKVGTRIDVPLLENIGSVMEALNGLILTQEQMEKNGYITRGQTEDDKIESLNKDAFESKYIDCIRCKMKFQRCDVKKEVTCKYHPSKRQYNFEGKFYEYPCCGETTLSVSPQRLGCKVFEHHVYKDEGFKLLSKISPFFDTKDIDGVTNVISIDCEMGFTTLGYEMIRLTLVDFFTNKVLFDQITRPVGEILDLNSEYSGVHQIKDSESLSYNDAMKNVLGNTMINKNSILIGHGFENDLNVMRLFHDKCIDTAVMFLRKETYKQALKDLAFKMLGVRIQTGEHDSAIDAITTMNIVKKHLNIPIDRQEWS